MKYVIENTDGTLHTILHMYNAEGKEIFEPSLIDAAVIDTPSGPFALPIPSPEAIHTIQ